MTITEIYLFLLADSFITSLVLPAKQDLVYTAMKIFGGYNLFIAGFLVTIGTTIAACVNWLFGKMLLSFKKYAKDNKGKNDKIIKMIKPFQTHGYLLGIFSFIPVFGPIILVFSGLLQVRFTKIIGVVFTINIIYYTLIAILN